MAAAIPIIAVAASVAGTVYSAYSQERAGEKAEKAEERRAAMLTQQATREKENRQQDARRLLAIQRAKIGASGITTEGSPLLNLMETQAQLEKDLLYAQQIADWGISEKLREGEAYRRAGQARAGATLLTGLGNLGTTWYSQYRQSQQPKSIYEYKDELTGWDYW